MKAAELNTLHYNSFYQRYIDMLPGDKSLGFLLRENKKEVLSLIQTIPDDKRLFRYEPEKWSVAEVLQHMIDVERIFQFRALSIARKEAKPLAGFDHDAYVFSSEANRRNLKDLEEEFRIVRDSSIALYDSFSKEMLSHLGEMNAAPASPAAIGFIMVGHATHHLKLLKERYKL